ncbi:MAG: hypothetical protein EON94_16845, partial [Caulobacteraceae bacterium]
MRCGPPETSFAKCTGRNAQARQAIRKGSDSSLERLLPVNSHRRRPMLGDSQAYATIAVRDVDGARRFYEETLGLECVESRPGVSTYDSGGSKILVYASEHAGTNQATSATWAVKDLEAVVADLRAKGVAFEHYPD